MTEVSCRAGLKWDGGSKKTSQNNGRLQNLKYAPQNSQSVNEIVVMTIQSFFFFSIFYSLYGDCFFLFFLYDSFVVKLLTLHYFTLFQGYCHTTQRLWWSRNWPLTSPLRMVWQFQATKPISLWQKPSKQGS